MPGGFPIGADSGCVSTIGANVSASAGTTITASATANVKGGWVEIGIVPFDCDSITLTMNYVTATVIMDIAVGTSGSEIVIISNIFLSSGNFGQPISIPLQIPAGTQISVRSQSATGSATLQMIILCHPGGFTQSAGFSGGDGLNVNLATSLANNSIGGTPSSTKGSWLVVIASTVRDYAGFILTFGALSSGPFLYDFATGISGHEVIFASNVYYLSGALSFYLPFFVPKGTRLLMRQQCATASGYGRTQMIGLYQ